jgi:4-hydroxy-3-methylbut-2-enyl diphosphate reductase
VRAIDIVTRALAEYGLPLYVRKEIVHNKYVVNDLRQKGTVFIDELDEVPPGNLVIFSAHGVSPDVRREAVERKLRVIDATCPLVTKVHAEAIRYARQGYTIILIGHADHDEVIGTLGEAPESIRVLGSADEVQNLKVADPSKVVYLTQTTLSLDDTKHIIERLRERFPEIQSPSSEDICYATQNRQSAVLELAKKAEIILVVGSANSSNSCRLVEVARSQGVKAYLIDDIENIRQEWIEGIRCVGLTAGASAPESLVERVLRYLNDLGFPEVETVGSIREDVEFAVPVELTRPRRQPK